jgi:serine protease Do
MSDKHDNNRGDRDWFKKPLGYFIAGVTAAAVSAGIFAGAQYFSNQRAERNLLDNPAVAESKLPPSTDAGVSQLKKTAESFRQIAKLVGPAVVNIKSTKAVKQPRAGRGGRHGRPQQQSPDDDDGGGMGRDPFQEFFERFGQPFPFMQEAPQTSLGSGIIVDKRGYVVTNNHVVEDSAEILVSLSDQKMDLKAKIVGTDPKTDLAVLKIENGKEFPFAEWADSDSVEVGDWAIAIGSPFALGQSVTVGIVSAKGRNSQQLTGSEYGGDLIQTDAAINPGNSGGPLCTIEGKIMGVNTAIYTRSGGYMGIGFAIPSNLAKDVVGKLITEGKIVRGWLGVYIQPLDPDLAKELDVKDGVGVHEVIEGSPAAEAGLKAGDVVIEVDGKPVKEVTQLQRVISTHKPGEKVKIKVVSYSDKKTRNMTVKVGEVPDKDKDDAKVSKEEAAPDKLGLILSETKGKPGVVVDVIQPGSFADQVGLEVGDIILRINRKEVTSIATYKKLVGDSKRLYFDIKRKGRQLFYQFVLPE